LVAAEMAGVVLMSYAVLSVFRGLVTSSVLRDAVRLTAAVCAVLTVAALAQRLPVPQLAGERSAAVLRLGIVVVTTLVAALPALHFTGSLSATESKALVSVFRRRMSLNAQ